MPTPPRWVYWEFNWFGLPKWPKLWKRPEKMKRPPWNRKERTSKQCLKHLLRCVWRPSLQTSREPKSKPWWPSTCIKETWPMISRSRMLMTLTGKNRLVSTGRQTKTTVWYPSRIGRVPITTSSSEQRKDFASPHSQIDATSLWLKLWACTTEEPPLVQLELEKPKLSRIWVVLWVFLSWSQTAPISINTETWLKSSKGLSNLVFGVALTSSIELPWKCFQSSECKSKWYPQTRRHIKKSSCSQKKLLQ